MKPHVWPVIGCLAAASACSTRTAKAPVSSVPAVVSARKASPSAVKRAMETHAKVAKDRQVRNAIDLGEGDAESRILRERLIAAPEDTQTRAALAARYQTLGMADLAIEHLRIATERNPGDAAIHLQLAQLLDRAGHTEMAAVTLDRYLAGYESEAPAAVHSWAGILRDKMGQAAAAEPHHRAAVRLEPEKAFAHNNLGQNLLLQSRPAEAAACFAAALKIEPRSEIARNNMAVALLGSDPAEAIHQLKSVSDPSTAHNNLAAIYLEHGRYREARQQLNLALGYRADNPAALKNLALVSELDGRPAQWTLSSPSSPAQAASASSSRWQRMRRALNKVFVTSEPDNQQPRSGSGNQPAKRAGKANKPAART